MTEKKDSLPQCNWLNKTLIYQLFVIFNHYLGEDNVMIITGNFVLWMHVYINVCVSYVPVYEFSCELEYKLNNIEKFEPAKHFSYERLCQLLYNIVYHMLITTCRTCY